MAIDLSKMTTEASNKASLDLDKMTPLEVVTLMNKEDAKVPEAIKPHLPQIAQAVEWCISSLQSGGRIIYMGAGTSGRLGVVDASECPPTFGVPSTMWCDRRPDRTGKIDLRHRYGRAFQHVGRQCGEGIGASASCPFFCSRKRCMVSDFCGCLQPSGVSFPRKPIRSCPYLVHSCRQSGKRQMTFLFTPDTIFQVCVRSFRLSPVKNPCFPQAKKEHGPYPAELRFADHRPGDAPCGVCDHFSGAAFLPWIGSPCSGARMGKHDSLWRHSLSSSGIWATTSALLCFRMECMITASISSFSFEMPMFLLLLISKKIH